MPPIQPIAKPKSAPSQDAGISISDAESHVMQLLWQRSPAPQTTEDIALVLQAQQGWQLSTIKTLLNRLLSKGAISAQQDGRRYLYRPVLQHQAWLAEQSSGLLDRWFGGQLTPLVAHFAAHRKLKRADLLALKQLLQDHERG
jgi:BlaI family transcriptional regulator, penicillinase repressor